MLIVKIFREYINFLDYFMYECYQNVLFFVDGLSLKKTWRREEIGGVNLTWRLYLCTLCLSLDHSYLMGLVSIIDDRAERHDF